MSNVVQIPTTPNRWQIVAAMAEAMDVDPTRKGDFLNKILEVFPELSDPESDPAGAAMHRLVTVLLQGSDYEQPLYFQAEKYNAASPNDTQIQFNMTEPGYIYQETTGAPLKMWTRGARSKALNGIEGKRLTYRRIGFGQASA